MNKESGLIEQAYKRTRLTRDEIEANWGFSHDFEIWKSIIQKQGSVDKKFNLFGLFTNEMRSYKPTIVTEKVGTNLHLSYDAGQIFNWRWEIMEVGFPILPEHLRFGIGTDGRFRAAIFGEEVQVMTKKVIRPQIRVRTANLDDLANYREVLEEVQKVK